MNLITYSIKAFLIVFAIVSIFIDVEMIIESYQSVNSLKTLIMLRLNELVNIGSEMANSIQSIDNVTLASLAHDLSLIVDTVLYKVFPPESLICFVLVLWNDIVLYIVSFQILRDLFNGEFDEILRVAIRFISSRFISIFILFLSYAEPLERSINSLIASI